MSSSPGFAKNLQELCTHVKSVSGLCRELSLNRQQFARYLSGESMPSRFNLRKLADHFETTIDVLCLPHAEFMAAHAERRSTPKQSKVHPVGEALVQTVDELAKLKAFTGYYFVFMQTPSEPTMLLKSLIHIEIEGGRCVSRWDETFTRSKDGSFQASRYEGIVRYLNGHLFIIDIEMSARETILETILQVPYRRKAKVLLGVTTGITTGQQRVPFASVVAFKSLGKRIHWASSRKQCGFVEAKSTLVDPIVRNAFAEPHPSHVYSRAQ